MNRNRYEIARRDRIVARVNRDYPDHTPEDRGMMVEELIEEELRLEAVDRADYLENIEDTPCVESADIWGTGEGRYHGIIG